MQIVYAIWSEVDLGFGMEEMLFKTPEAAHKFLADDLDVQDFMQEMHYETVEQMFETGQMRLLDMYLQEME